MNNMQEQRGKRHCSQRRASHIKRSGRLHLAAIDAERELISKISYLVLGPAPVLIA